MPHLREPTSEQVSDVAAVISAVEAGPADVLALANERPSVDLGASPVLNVLLTTKRLTTGGVSGVLLAQARILSQAGFVVTVVVRAAGEQNVELPPGVECIQLEANELVQQLGEWESICRDRRIDVVVDHQILYGRDWPGFALMNNALGIPTIGWLHNFAARPIYDLTKLTSFLTQYMPILSQLIVLSPLDAIYWKLRGIRDVSFLPNPPSPMMIDSAPETVAKSSPVGRRVELIWWGRLDEHTKQVRQFLALAIELKRLDVDFRIRVIGPGWRKFSPEKMRTFVRKRGLDEFIDVVGPLYGDELIAAAESADVFVSTSVIEGYPLTLLEAQASGLPILMYEMPWLLQVHQNSGVVSVPQGDVVALAREIAKVSNNGDLFQQLSLAAQQAAADAAAFDFDEAYSQLLAGELPRSFSPDPDLEKAKDIIDLFLFFVERHAGVRSRRDKKEAYVRHSSKQRGSVLKRAAKSVVRRVRPYGHLALSLTPGLRPTVKKIYYAAKRKL